MSYFPIDILVYHMPQKMCKNYFVHKYKDDQNRLHSEKRIEDAIAITQSQYDAFMKVYSDDTKMEELRAQAIKDYVQATGIEVTQYQDYGWDPVKL